VRFTTLLNKLINLDGLWITDVTFDAASESLVVSIRRRFQLLTCPLCGHRKRGRFSTSERTWRHVGIWGRPVVLKGEIRRMRCDRCGKAVTESVPWARHDSDFTRPFEDAVALLAQQTNKTAVSRLTGVAWVTVGNISERVVSEHLDPDRFTNLRRIGVDEISFRRRHRYLTIVTDHDRRRVVWVAEGKSSDVLKAFFEEVGPKVCEQIEIVTMDMSGAYEKAVRESLPHAQIAFDHFHVAKLANEALNEVRRQLVREATPETKSEIKNTRWPLLHRFENADEKHHEALSRLRPHEPLGRAYLLKEMLLEVLHQRARKPEQALAPWLAWASRCRLRPFVRLGRTLRRHLPGIVALMRERLTNGLAEGMNNKIRLLSHRAFGFHSARPLIADIFLCCGGIRLPQLQLL